MAPPQHGIPKGWVAQVMWSQVRSRGTRRTRWEYHNVYDTAGRLRPEACFWLVQETGAGQAPATRRLAYRDVSDTVSFHAFTRPDVSLETLGGWLEAARPARPHPARLDIPVRPMV